MTGSLSLIELIISVDHGKNYYLKIVLLGRKLTLLLCVKSLLYTTDIFVLLVLIIQ